MPKYFTPQEASALIPQLTTILRDLQECKRELDNKEAELKDTQQRAKSNGHSRAKELESQRAALDGLVNRLNQGVARVDAIGCQLKDIALGLIDFPALRQGKVVLLCWRLGEAEISYWHGTDTGYASRQPW